MIECRRYLYLKKKEVALSFSVQCQFKIYNLVCIETFGKISTGVKSLLFKLNKQISKCRAGIVCIHAASPGLSSFALSILCFQSLKHACENMNSD